MAEHASVAGICAPGHLFPAACYESIHSGLLVAVPARRQALPARPALHLLGQKACRLARQALTPYGCLHGAALLLPAQACWVAVTAAAAEYGIFRLRLMLSAHRHDGGDWHSDALLPERHPSLVLEYPPRDSMMRL